MESELLAEEGEPPRCSLPPRASISIVLAVERSAFDSVAFCAAHDNNADSRDGIGPDV